MGDGGNRSHRSGAGAAVLWRIDRQHSADHAAIRSEFDEPHARTENDAAAGAGTEKVAGLMGQRMKICSFKFIAAALASITFTALRADAQTLPATSPTTRPNSNGLH